MTLSIANVWHPNWSGPEMPVNVAQKQKTRCKVSLLVKGSPLRLKVKGTLSSIFFTVLMQNSKTSKKLSGIGIGAPWSVIVRSKHGTCEMSHKTEMSINVALKQQLSILSLFWILGLFFENLQVRMKCLCPVACQCRIKPQTTFLLCFLLARMKDLNLNASCPHLRRQATLSNGVTKSRLFARWCVLVSFLRNSSVYGASDVSLLLFSAPCKNRWCFLKHLGQKDSTVKLTLTQFFFCWVHHLT